MPGWPAGAWMALLFIVGRPCLGTARPPHQLSFLAMGTRDLPMCTCDCCNVAQRRAGEEVQGVGIKCAPSNLRGPDICGEECMADQNDKVLPTNEGALDMLRYCFFECKPVAGLASLPSAECVPWSTPDLKYVIDESGNARDPAFALVAAAKASEAEKAAESKK